MSPVIGKAIARVDGRLKVTGGAHYSARFNADACTLTRTSLPPGSKLGISFSFNTSEPPYPSITTACISFFRN